MADSNQRANNSRQTPRSGIPAVSAEARQGGAAAGDAVSHWRRLGISGGSWRGIDWAIAAIVAIIALAVYGNSTDGEFVYDDVPQIVENPLIQRNDLIGQALTSDVWAFKGAADPKSAGSPDARRGVSNYYRPVFVGFLIIEHRLFGLSNAKPWHVANMLLHAFVSVLAFALIRRVLGAHGRSLAGACAMVFAVHPVHVESVTWISGSPDLLMGVGMLAAMLSASRMAERWACRRVEGQSAPCRATLASTLDWAVLVLGSILSVGSKEVGIMVAPLVALMAWESTRAFHVGNGANEAGAASATASRCPFSVALRAAITLAVVPCLLAASYLLARSRIVGHTKALEDAPTWVGMFVSIPRVIMFYLRECTWPWENLWSLTSAVGPGGVGPTHPVRPVDPAVLGTAPGLTLFWVPLAACLLVAGVVLACLWYRSGLRFTREKSASNRPFASSQSGNPRAASAIRIGIAVFVLTLLPALYIRALPAEHMVRDRYLYMPLLGLLMMLVGIVLPSRSGSRRWTGAQGVAVACAFAMICAAFAVKTWKTTEPWTSSLALWTAAARHDPTAALPLSELGRLQSLSSTAEGLRAAVETYTRALQQRRMVLVLSGRAGTLIKLGDLEAATIGPDSGKMRAQAVSRYQQAEIDARDALGPLGGGQLVGVGGDSASLQVFDHLAVALERQGKLVDPPMNTGRPAPELASAASVLRRSRQLHPFAAAKITQRLAVVLYVAGQRREAKSELESALEGSRTELSPEAPMVLYRLALICAEPIPADTASVPPLPAIQPDFPRAVQLLREFITRTESPLSKAEKEIAPARQRAQSILAKVPPEPAMKPSMPPAGK